jgi:hypothetical protein
VPAEVPRRCRRRCRGGAGGGAAEVPAEVPRRLSPYGSCPHVEDTWTAAQFLPDRPPRPLIIPCTVTRHRVNPPHHGLMRLLLLLVLSAAAFAESPRSYFVTAGPSWASLGVGITPGSYLYTLVERGKMTQGYAKVLATHDRFSLVALGDAGVSTADGATFAGGASVTYDISRWVKVKKTFAIITVKASDAGTRLYFGLGKNF